MTRRFIALIAAVLLAGMLSACGEPELVEAPPAEEPTRDAIGYYCSMTVVDHPGPKGQIHLAGQSTPIWFSSVRDTVAFTMLPEERKDITAVYVNDMARAETWDRPEAGTWIAAKDAVYVLGSSRRGGMGAPEAVPFGDRTAAAAFAAAHGGHIVPFTEIPRVAILGNPNDSAIQHAKRHTPGPDKTISHTDHGAGHRSTHDEGSTAHGEHKH